MDASQPRIKEKTMPNIIEITDISAPELDVYSRMTEPQLRSKLDPSKGIFIAESPTVIEIALNAGHEALSFLVERKHVLGQAAKLIARCPNTPVYTADVSVLSKLTGYQLTRGVFCAMRRPSLPTLSSVCSGASRLAVMDGIVDSTNVGAIFRSAAALGIDGVVLTSTCCDPLCRRAIRVSMGTVFQLPWTKLPTTWKEDGVFQLPWTKLPTTDEKDSVSEPHQTENAPSTHFWTHALKTEGFKLAAMALTDDSISIDDAKLTAEPKLAIVMGTEGTGLTAETIDLCDYTVKIPMSHGVDSLNVAAASAVAFWQLRKR